MGSRGSCPTATSRPVGRVLHEATGGNIEARDLETDAVVFSRHVDQEVWALALALAPDGRRSFVATLAFSPSGERRPPVHGLVGSDPAPVAARCLGQARSPSRLNRTTARAMASASKGASELTT